MKHAGLDTLRQLESLLNRLRAVPGLVERKPGAFYLRSSAFLHFHEDPTGIYADAKLDGSSFERRQLRTAADQSSLLKAVSADAAHSRKSKGDRGAVE